MALPLLNRDNDVVNRCLDEISKIDYGETFRIEIARVAAWSSEGLKEETKRANIIRNQLINRGRGYTVNVYTTDLSITSDCKRFTQIGLSKYQHKRKVA